MLIHFCIKLCSAVIVQFSGIFIAIDRIVLTLLVVPLAVSALGLKCRFPARLEGGYASAQST
jgi:hypothetical protein